MRELLLEGPWGGGEEHGAVGAAGLHEARRRQEGGDVAGAEQRERAEQHRGELSEHHPAQSVQGDGGRGGGGQGHTRNSQKRG